MVMKIQSTRGSLIDVKMRKILYITILLMAVMVVFLWLSGLFGLWSSGMRYIANNTEEYTNINGHQMDGMYSIKVDLSDLESNIGKDIYHDGEHRIYVTSLQRTHNGGYEIGFRSIGQYSLSGATLVSGLHHETINDHFFTTSTTAKLSAEYDDNTFEARVTGRCGLNYKDGDCFSFTFFLKDESNEENNDVTGKIEITITDLYKNTWRKK